MQNPESQFDLAELPATEFDWLAFGELRDQQIVVAAYHFWIQVMDLLTFCADSAQLVLSLGNLLQDLSST